MSGDKHVSIKKGLDKRYQNVNTDYLEMEESWVIIFLCLYVFSTI